MKLQCQNIQRALEVYYNLIKKTKWGGGAGRCETRIEGIVQSKNKSKQGEGEPKIQSMGLYN